VAELCLRVHAQDLPPRPAFPTPSYEGCPAPRDTAPATPVSAERRSFEGQCGGWLRRIASALDAVHGRAFDDVDALLPLLHVDGAVFKYHFVAEPDSNSNSTGPAPTTTEQHPRLPSSDSLAGVWARVGGRRVAVRVFLPVCIHREPLFYLPVHDRCDGQDGVPAQGDKPDDAQTVPVPEAEAGAAAAASTVSYRGAGRIPLVLVGPGTGITPLMSFIRHKRALATPSEAQSAVPLVPNTARAASLDWFSAEALEAAFPGLRVQDCAPGRIVLINKAYEAATDTDSGVSAPVGSLHVYTGNRHRLLDVLYLPELLARVADGTISTLRVACSREAPDGSLVTDSGRISSPSSPASQAGGDAAASTAALSSSSSSTRTLVQDLIAEDGPALAALLASGAGVYVCGDATAMARDVQRAIEAALASACVGDVSAGWGNQGLWSGNFWTRFSASRYHPDTRGWTWADQGPPTQAPFVADSLNPLQCVQYDEVLRRDPRSLPEEQRVVWARALVMRMLREGQYKQDVWA
jgi:hypothetical protein